jgi:hypothetical protein
MRMKPKHVGVVFVLACLVVFSLGLSQALASNHMKNAGQAELRVGLMIGSMQADMLEGVEEAFAYLLLDSKLEKSEFFDKMRDLDAQARKFKKLAKQHSAGKNILELFGGVQAARVKLEKAANRMFASFEKTGAPVQTDIMMFEDAVDQLTGLWETLMQAGVSESLRKRFIDDKQAASSMHLHHMHAALLEAVEEAFAYLLLNEPVERADFVKNMKDFNRLAAEFKAMGHLYKPGNERHAVQFHKMMAAKEMVSASAQAMFWDFTREGTPDHEDLLEFEHAVDAFGVSFEQLLEDYIQ